MNKITSILKDNQALRAFLAGQNISVNGTDEEALLIASAFLSRKQNILVIKSSQYEANKLYQNLTLMLGDDVSLFPVDESYRIESLAASPELLQERILTLYNLCRRETNIIITHPQAVIRYLPTKELFKENIFSLKVGDIIDPLSLQAKILQAGYHRINRVNEPFYFSRRGGVIDIFSVNQDQPIRIEFFDDEIDSIREYDAKTQHSIKEIDEVTIVPASDILYRAEELAQVKQKIKFIQKQQENDLNDLEREELIEKINLDLTNLDSHDTGSSMYVYYNLFKETASILDYQDQKLVVIASPGEVDKQIDNYISENYFYNNELVAMGKILKGLDYYLDYSHLLTGHKKQLINWFSDNKDIYFNTREITIDNAQEQAFIAQIKDYLQNNRVLFVLEDQYQINIIIELLENYQLKYKMVSLEERIYPGINISLGTLPFGIELIDEKLVIITANEIYPHRRKQKITYIRYKEAQIIKNYQELNPGDYVVHDMHGIGKYQGIKTLEVKGYRKDYLQVTYANDDTLYIPVEQFKLIRKYASAQGKVPQINKLGDSKWARAKAKARAKIDDIADQLISLYATRMAAKGFAFPPDDQYQLAFEADFGFELTPDQKRSIQEIKKDMEQEQPMDRLLCGDVGFGKTEVALIAAFKAIRGNKQVAFMCPTTILSSQHYQTAIERFKNFPIEIALINRFVSNKKIKEILVALKAGKIDLLIGTHRLLSNDVIFKDLGLLLVDEEQRFGVKQKEKIKEIRKTIDVLSMTATPIPRTLQLSLMGIRGLSQIETPPTNRLPVQTYVTEKNNTLITQIIKRELARDGQVFYLYNHTDLIQNVAYNLALRIPEARIGIGHGQMKKDDLEKVMYDFINKQTNVLVCTTIIETGIDIPNANTIIIDEADHFGLSQLYQIKGRVGRSNRSAYAYLLYNPKKNLSAESQKRLKAIREFTELGSGYKLALRDLSIRGSGDILGGKQAGFIDSVGFEMYMKILHEALDEKAGKALVENKEVDSLNIEVDGYIPSDYVESDIEKLELYQDLAGVTSLSQLQEIQNQFKDYYGQLPSEIINLIEKRKLDILAQSPDIKEIVDEIRQITVVFSQEFSTKIAGDDLFIEANNIFTKPRFKSYNNEIAIIINKTDNWLVKLNSLIIHLKRSNP